MTDADRARKTTRHRALCRAECGRPRLRWSRLCRLCQREYQRRYRALGSPIIDSSAYSWRANPRVTMAFPLPDQSGSLRAGRVR